MSMLIYELGTDILLPINNLLKLPTTRNKIAVYLTRLSDYDATKRDIDMFTRKMKDLPVSGEAKVFYLSNCLRDADFVEVQPQVGVDPPKIRVDYGYAISLRVAYRGESQ